MKNILLTCVLLVCAICAHAYEVVATVSIEGDNKWYFDIQLANNNLEFTAFQVDVILDGDAELTSDDITKSDLTKDHHTMAVGKSGERRRIVGYSMENKPLNGMEGNLFSFIINGNVNGITIDKIIFSKADGTEVEAKPYVRPLDRDNDDALGSVSADKEAAPATYDLEGKQVYRIDRRGIYIRNGKKIAK